MRKILSILLILALVLPMGCAWAEGEMSITAPDTAIRPGKAYIISFELPEAANVDITLEDSMENRLSVVVLDHPSEAGLNQMWWNGTYNGVPAPEGSYRLVLTTEAGETAETPVTIGTMAPYLTSINADTGVITAGQTMTVSYYAGAAGRLTTGVWYGSEWRQLASWSVTAGPGSMAWDGAGFYDGDYVFTLMLTDAEGATSNEEHLQVALSGFGAMPEQAVVTMEPQPEETAAPVQQAQPEATAEPDDLFEDVAEIIEPDVLLPEDDELIDLDLILDDELVLDDELDLDDEPTVDEPADNDQKQYTPSYGSPYTGMDTTLNYWTLPMDITDEDAVWQMLMQPITVLDIGKKSSEKVQVYLRARPDADSEPVGVVTCETQGVHVLETTSDGWSLVETYSSSFHDTKVEAWNMLVRGYIQTSYLKQVKPSTKFGIVVDKLTQRLYLFKDGKLYSTLLVSTGLANERQPYNETRSGEFISASKVGEFRSDNLYCSMAVRFNSGDLLHEVPHTKNKDGSGNYAAAEAKLGTRASHGCIRVQRRKTPEGVNMAWIWNNVKTNSHVRIVIWEDWQGRQIPIPADDFQLYYNAKGGKYYHSAEKCASASGRTFAAFNYGQLEEPEFAKLTRCPYCAPELRRSEIEAINAEHALGGDHDPILTKLRVGYNEYLEELQTSFLK